MNPLSHCDALPDYSAIRPEHAEPAIRSQIEANRVALRELLKQPTRTFQNLVAPFEKMQARLARVFAPIGHLNAVMNTTEMRAAYNACLPLLTDYQTEVGQNVELADAYAAILKTEEASLTDAQRRVLTHALREFDLAGVRLDAAPKARFRDVMQELAQLQSRFEENVLDATQAWTRLVTVAGQLAGLPEHVVLRAREQAKSEGKEGWLLKLDQPTYLAVMTHADDESLRREFYEAWNTRASDVGPTAGRFDNGPVMSRILALRHEAASLLGFDNFAELSLATKMARTVPEVLGFLGDLARAYRPAAKKEFNVLENYAGRSLSSWDVTYFSDKMRREQMAVSEEALRPWFPLPRVLNGFFALVERLYGIRFVPRTDVAVWHPDAQYLDVLHADGTPLGGLYTDWYARDHKRGGAWMGEVAVRESLNGAHRIPVANIVCNFTPPSGSQPALLRHTDVVTLFHEFGHALHHLLTEVDFPSLSGINGVPWDAVELPSQIMEQWCWHEEVLGLISSHVDDRSPLPPEMLARLIASRTFQAGLQGVRQLEFALFDFSLHADSTAVTPAAIAATLGRVRAAVSVLAPPSWNRFQHGFQHIFAGGYAAGYYSYKWAEVLAADAFSAFDEAGLFDHATAMRFRREVLSKGGACDPMEAFIAFRGRRPDASALLRQDGIAA
jgi:oligopeptidase A